MSADTVCGDRTETNLKLLGKFLMRLYVGFIFKLLDAQYCNAIMYFIYLFVCLLFYLNEQNKYYLDYKWPKLNNLSFF